MLKKHLFVLCARKVAIVHLNHQLLLSVQMELMQQKDKVLVYLAQKAISVLLVQENQLYVN